MRSRMIAEQSHNMSHLGFHSENKQRLRSLANNADAVNRALGVVLVLVVGDVLIEISNKGTIENESRLRDTTARENTEGSIQI